MTEPTSREPLSSDAGDRVKGIIQGLIDRHKGETISYTSCQLNGCWVDGCVLRVRSKDGKVTAIEPDDTINPHDPREEVSDKALEEGMIQLRPCAMAYARRQELYNPERIVYPMKRLGERGDGKFERITWDEALDTIAEKMKEVKEKYGPYSIWSPGFGGIPLEFSNQFFEVNSAARLFFHFGAGVGSWASQSREASNFAATHLFGTFDPTGPPPPAPSEPPAEGEPGTDASPTSLSSHEAPDIFNAKCILLWGFNPLEAQNGTLCHYLRVARERGIPSICIEPRYTWTAEVVADQWIPIRPGTDMTMLLGITNVLFSEDIYDKEFIEKFVEETGFEKWRQYVLGSDDGIEKSPEWAEKICGVPAETMIDLARKLATSKPCAFYFGQAAGRQVYGEDAQRGANYLAAMIGCMGAPGGGVPTENVTITHSQVMAPFVDLGRAPGDYWPPVLINWNKWPAAVLLREKYDAGEITKEEYCREIGNAVDNPLPNLKMRLDLGYLSNSANNIMGSKDHVEALKKQEFTAVCSSYMTLTAKHADIVLPIANSFFEHDHYRDDIQVMGLGNFMIYSPKTAEPPGEAKSRLWICTKLAERLGIVDKYNPAYNPNEEWDEMSERLHREAYEKWRQLPPVVEKVGATPGWEEFKKKSVIRFPIKEPYRSLQDQIRDGRPFPTESGKIEFYSERAAQIDENSYYGNNINPIAEWKSGGWGTFTDLNVSTYPLMMLTPHPLFRQHSLNDNNALLRDEYRHGVWLNPADAKSRGIKDNDSVKVYNDLGAMVIPAYVTSRVVPGVAIIYHGAWYEPDEKGIDRRGSVNALIHNKHRPQTTTRVLRATDLVEIEKVKEAGQ